jgi:hypothetical protein
MVVDQDPGSEYSDLRALKQQRQARIAGPGKIRTSGENLRTFPLPGGLHPLPVLMDTISGAPLNTVAYDPVSSLAVPLRVG